ncbi:MAG: hypothetical protein IT384_04080 [Deltaproteobacteria bacterium]|nr:hypothetical protein [Deltaproteobacteria bacterium]
MTGADGWSRQPLAYQGRFGQTFDIFAASIPLTTPAAQSAAALIGVAFGLDLHGQTFWLQSPRTNLTAGPSNVRGLAGVSGAQTPSGGSVVVRQDRTEDPGKSTLHFELQDNAGLFQDGSGVQLKVAISSAKRFGDGRATAARTDRPMVLLTRISPNRYAGSVDFTHDSAHTADPRTSYSREIDRLSALPISHGVQDGEGDGVTLMKSS